MVVVDGGDYVVDVDVDAVFVVLRDYDFVVFVVFLFWLIVMWLFLLFCRLLSY